VAEQVPNDCSLILNIGTTTEAIAKALLHHRGLRVITNNLNVAAILSSNPECEVIVAGGVVRARDRGIVGEAAVDFIRQFKVDIALIGISGIEPDGSLRDFDYREVKVAQTIIEQSREVWLAADHSKFNRPAMVQLATLNQIDRLFTDAPPPEPFPALLQDAGVICTVSRRCLTLLWILLTMTYLLALDQGTSSSRSIVFDERGHIVAQAQLELPQIYPQPGWVEHDPLEIWRTQLATARDALAKAGMPPRRAGGGHHQPARNHGAVEPQAPASPCTTPSSGKTGAPSPPVPSCANRATPPPSRPKPACWSTPTSRAPSCNGCWTTCPAPRRGRARRAGLWHGGQLADVEADRRPGARHRREQRRAHHAVQCAHQPVGRRAAGAAAHPQGAAARGAAVQRHFGDTAADLLGHAIRIGGVAGDQQSALFGQACFTAGMAKNTYGTGCFMLMHTGGTFQTSHNGLLTTSAAQATASSLSSPWKAASCRRRRGAVAARRPARHPGSSEVQALAESVPDSGGVMMVPAFTGLGAPYWKPDARGTITGLTRGTTMAHIARAALESIAYQSAALLLAMSRDAVAAGGAPVSELRVDGGACVNDLLMQFQADLLGIPVVRPAVIETTALGAAYLAGCRAACTPARHIAPAAQRDGRGLHADAQVVVAVDHGVFGVVGQHPEQVAQPAAPRRAQGTAAYGGQVPRLPALGHAQHTAQRPSGCRKLKATPSTACGMAPGAWHTGRPW
jgi:glycerol kinase